jgi:hypothetical protein
MKFLCPFCNTQCKSNSGLARHTRLKHNFCTRLQLSNWRIDNNDEEDNNEIIENVDKDNGEEYGDNHEPTIGDFIIHEPTGGVILDGEEAIIRHNEFIARIGWVPASDESDIMNNPLHPWKHEGEIWLTDLLFRSGNISQKTADKFLGAFANGRISMADGPIQFTNS